MHRRLLAVPAGLALAVFAAGCGGDKLKGSELEDRIESAGSAYTSVDCPDEIEAKKGVTFTCDAETTKGPFVITVRISSVKDGHGRMTIVKATPKKP